MRREPPDPGPLLAKLNHRQRAFVEAWIKTSHATNAAAAAGYTWPGKQGSRLLSRPDIRAVIATHCERLWWEWEVRMKEEVARRAAEVAELVRRKGHRRRRCIAGR